MEVSEDCKIDTNKQKENVYANIIKDLTKFCSINQQVDSYIVYDTIQT